MAAWRFAREVRGILRQEFDPVVGRGGKRMRDRGGKRMRERGEKRM
jgi:hypothetical protein